MGYSGYREYLCTSGHYSAHDAYESDYNECPRCGASMAYVHGVDQTNGYDESEPYSCNAPKEEIGFDDVWHVDHHGNRYATKLVKFRPISAWKEVV